MSTTLDNSAMSLVHQQSDVLEYINEIAQELAQMAERAGCAALGHDLRRALIAAHGSGDMREISQAALTANAVRNGCKNHHH